MTRGLRGLAVAAAMMVTEGVSADAPAPNPSLRAVSVDDGYLAGRPTAPIRVVIVSSFTCPHCGDLDRAAMPSLMRDWISTGRASVRFVPYIMFPTDLPAVIAADCGAAKGFFARSRSLFAMQNRMTSGWESVPAGEKNRLQKSGKTEQTAALMNASGIPSNLGSIGLRRVDLTRCMTDEAMRTRIRTRQELVERRYHPQGTPTVLINGRPTGTGASWPRLQQALAQVAR